MDWWRMFVSGDEARGKSAYVSLVKEEMRRAPWGASKIAGPHSSPFQRPWVKVSCRFSTSNLSIICARGFGNRLKCKFGSFLLITYEFVNWMCVKTFPSGNGRTRSSSAKNSFWVVLSIKQIVIKLIIHNKILLFLIPINCSFSGLKLTSAYVKQFNQLAVYFLPFDCNLCFVSLKQNNVYINKIIGVKRLKVINLLSSLLNTFKIACVINSLPIYKNHSATAEHKTQGTRKP